MSGMNTFLAEAYGTTQPLQQSENADKVAQAELFAKLAADNNIDLSKLDDAQVVELWNTTFGTEGAKVAAKHGHKHKHKHGKTAAKHGHKHEHKKVAAAAFEEWSKTKEAQDKMAEADFLGRQMAHAYVHELKKIASEGKFPFAPEASAKPGEKTAAMPPALAAALGKGDEKKEGKHDEKKEEEEKKKEEEKKAAAAKTAAAAAAPPAGQKKVASNLTQLGAIKAIEKAAESGFDKDEATNRITAVFTLGLFDDSKTKVAAASQFTDAVEIRALEILEAAGYPVNWNGEQGK